MKHIIILGDGMADHPVGRLDNLTLLQYAHTPHMDAIARNGRTGMLRTIPQGYQPGSEVANTAILGYDLDEVYEGRGPLEAASIGYEMQPLDMAMRCNLLTLSDGKIKNHHGGHLTSVQGKVLIDYLNEHLGSDTVQFLPGVQYRHLLVIKGGSKHMVCCPPHDHPGADWRSHMVCPQPGWGDVAEPGRLTARATADLINELIIKSQKLLGEHPFNRERALGGHDTANSIWPWSGGYRPSMLTLSQIYPQVKSGAVISAVDLIRGIGHYAGLEIVDVEGATGQWDTNYAGKVAAAIEALKRTDFVFLHIEASDEAGHDGELDLKLRTITDLDSKVVGPILTEVSAWSEPVCVAVLPDHPTPVETRAHADEPVPFAIWHRGIEPDAVQAFDEESCQGGAYGMLHLAEFMQRLMQIQ